MSTSLNTKKKTILRVKRKFTDIEAVDTIVLSQPTKPKRQRTIPWNELTASFDKDFKINTVNDNDNNNDNEWKADNDKINKSIPNFFDFDYDQEPKNKKQVFRLISCDSLERGFQETNFNKNCSKNRKKNILQQRRLNREQHFKNIKKEIKSKNKSSIIQHEDFDDNDNDDMFTSNKANKFGAISNKLLFKHKFKRKCAKIVSKKEIKQHQNELKLRNNIDNNSKSVFCDDWNNNNLISLHHNGETINMRNFVNKYECFNGYLPKHLQIIKRNNNNNDNERGIDIITEMKMDNDNDNDYDIINVEYDEKQSKYIKIGSKSSKSNNGNDDGYDYYELDEEADADQVIAAIQMRSKYKKEKEREREKEELDENENENETENELDLEWKLEKIKNKHLTKHFSASYEGPSFGYKYDSKKSENARFIELEENDFAENKIVDGMDSNELQKYYENLLNEEEEIEKDDEGYIDNEYPDELELELSDYNQQYTEYTEYDQMSNYPQNSLGIDFFNRYDFN